MSCAADLRRVGALLVDLVDRHHDRHVGGLRVVDRLHRLRHHAVVGCDHQDRDVGGLGAAGTHGGERLVTRGVDEGDRPLRPVEVDADLVGADVLGDAAGLLLADVRLTDGVQQPGLAVVDVTHHGHHRRAGLQVFLAALVLAVGEVERFQQFAVLVLGGHDLNVVVHLAAQQLQRLVTDRLGGRDHLAEVEQRLHQGGGVGVDLLGEVAQRRAAGQPDGLAVAVRQPHAADDRRLHRVVFLTLLPLRLAPAPWRATRAPEGARGSAALTGTATTTNTPPPPGRPRKPPPPRGCTGTGACAAAAVVATTAATAGASAGPTTGTATGTATAGSGSGRRRDALDVLAHRRHRDGVACCRARRRGEVRRRDAGRPDGVPAGAGSAGRPAGPRRTGCCRRAGSGRRASGAAAGAGPGRGPGVGAGLACGGSGRRRGRDRRGRRFRRSRGLGGRRLLGRRGLGR